MEIEDIIRKNKVKRQSYVNVSDQKKVKVSSNYFKNLISRILITIILILGSIIFTKSSLDNKELYKKYVFENTLSFNKRMRLKVCLKL